MEDTVFLASLFAFNGLFQKYYFVTDVLESNVF